jgi:arylsulfatase
LIVHWPSRVQSRGELRWQPGHLIDIMATCVDVAQASYPTRMHGNSITPMEGKSLVPALDPNQPIEREALYWEHEGNRAIRVGKWKLVSKTNQFLKMRPEDRDDWELYDLEADRTEMHDLAERYPEKVEELKNKWNDWATRAHVLPWPWDTN